jgi:hypothetical protein
MVAIFATAKEVSALAMVALPLHIAKAFQASSPKTSGRSPGIGLFFRLRD